MKINVNLYGGKSIFKGVKETPLEAEVTYCDKCEIARFIKMENVLVSEDGNLIVK